MKKTFLIAVCSLLLCSAMQAAINCRFVTIHIDSNQATPLDIDNDGTNDYILLAEYSPYVNNYLVGLNGNQIEVTASSGVNADRARRIESGDPVGALAWNDTAYMIKNGQGSFSGGSEEYGHVGLRLNKSGNWHYAFIEVRAPYWQALVEVYAIGYNNVAAAETRTDACPLSIEERLPEAVITLSEKQLRIVLPASAQECELLVYNTAGQIMLREPLRQAESIIALRDVKCGVYIAAVMRQGKLLQRNKFTLAE